MSEFRKSLGIDDWLELVKEDKNLKGAYICLGQYMYLLEQENKQLKELKYKFFDASGDEESFTLEDYLDLSNKVYDLEQENQQLKEVIEEVRKSIKDFQEYIDEAKDFYSDLDDNDVVKVSNLQILNNQMVRNYDLLQILDKVKDSDVK